MGASRGYQVIVVRVRRCGPYSCNAYEESCRGNVMSLVDINELYKGLVFASGFVEAHTNKHTMVF